eukprot:TRINITY_DN6672_c0_g1_i2.p1 TRINITY_DN6672_c0_g1~~TRINITY_DN6672_c0_g1_i2.p1  ORF type:complete len:625 (+),score=176.50 TRINITY_DN6672_c0_g1_i2:17-1891(+)
MASLQSLRTAPRLVQQLNSRPVVTAPSLSVLPAAPLTTRAFPVRRFHKSLLCYESSDGSSGKSDTKSTLGSTSRDPVKDAISAGFTGKNSNSDPTGARGGRRLVDPIYMLEPYRNANGQIEYFTVPFEVLSQYERARKAYDAQLASTGVGSEEAAVSGERSELDTLRQELERDVARKSEERLLSAIDQLFADPTVTDDTFESRMEAIRTEVKLATEAELQRVASTVAGLRSKPREVLAAMIADVAQRSKASQIAISHSASDDPRVYTDGNRLPLTDRFYTNSVWVLSKDNLSSILPEGFAGGYRLDTKLHKYIKEFPFLVRKSAARLASWLEKAAASGFMNSKIKPYITLTGARGSGKSTALTQLVIWARQNNWIVVFIPDARYWVKGERIEESQYEDGMWDQNLIAAEFAGHMLAAHREQLKTLPLRLPVDLLNFDTTKQKTLADLLEYAVKDKESNNTDAIVHFRKELNLVTEFPVLIAVDGINVLFNNSPYGDPLSDSKLIIPPLPAQKLMLTRIFSDFDSHGLANGMYVTALCRTHPVDNYVARFGGIEYGIQVRGKNRATSNCYQIEPYSTFEYDMLVHYNRVHKLYPMEEQLTHPTKEFIYFTCQGNPAEISKYEKVL